MDKVEFEENIYYEQLENPDIFEVTIAGNPSAERCQLHGVYEFHINTENFAIVDKTQNKRLYTWPFRYVRRYGKSGTNFQFEAGRKCQSGEGLFSLLTNNGDSEKIFNLVQTRFNLMKKRDKEFQLGNLPSPASTRSHQDQSPVSPLRGPTVPMRKYENNEVLEPARKPGEPARVGSKQGKPKPPITPKPSIKKQAGSIPVDKTEAHNASQINSMLIKESKDILNEVDNENDGTYCVMGMASARVDAAQYSDVYSRSNAVPTYNVGDDTYDEVRLN